MITIDLPWPSRDLSPNARVHFMARARAVKAHRRSAALVASKVGRIDAERLTVTMIFSPPDAKRRDADNLVGRAKAYCDGVADAIGVDDSKWDISIRRAGPVRGGNVRFEIEVV